MKKGDPGLALDLGGADTPRVRLGGQYYVIVRESVFERLRAAAEQARVAGADGSVLFPLSLEPIALAKRLAERRRRVGFSQAELARRAGVRVETLNRIERGRTTPDFATIRKLVRAMNAPPSGRGR